MYYKWVTEVNKEKKKKILGGNGAQVTLGTFRAM